MKRLIAGLIVAFPAAFGAASLVHARILIGTSGPMTGSMAWFGEQMQQGMAKRVAELNATGGVLGQQVELLIVDDYCDPEQAIAAAGKLVEARVAAVIGHLCSGASIPASEVYAEAGILMISPYSSNPTLTEQGFANVFRVSGRDTIQAAMVSNYLAERWGDQDIAIVHDGQAYGKGIAEEARRRLGDRGVTEILFEEIKPGEVDYSKLIDKLQAEGIDALYFGGYTAEAALIIRQARTRGYDLEIVGSDALISEYFWHVAGQAAVGVRFVSYADPRTNKEAAALVEQFRADGYEPEGLTLYSYAGVQVWAQAVEKAGTVAPKAVAETLRTHQFDTVLGTIGFDEKGDVYGYEPFVWYVWQEGNYAPVDPAELTE
ncbi:MAG TPA: branched-chain amino acid ABC transporter substrate-binding protein [Geminicoccaceae bacterium]|nr:branched-chain amino acid ABC transporter substrate-binding protein [Geminicoccaceae bacterium]